jgi:hypothetical protein
VYVLLSCGQGEQGMCAAEGKPPSTQLLQVITIGSPTPDAKDRLCEHVHCADLCLMSVLVPRSQGQGWARLLLRAAHQLLAPAGLTSGSHVLGRDVVLSRE